jgi:GT2 family glycosyltransferase
VVETGRNAGYAAGINAAVAAAAERAEPFDAVLVLNPDIRLAPGCVPELLALLRQRGAGIAVPKIVRANGDFSPSLRREPTILRAFADAVLGARSAAFGESITDRTRYTDVTTVDWAEGSIMLIDKACWDACGGWDESFFLYSEETEYALRARDLGFTMMYTPSANARHLEGDAATNPPLWALMTLNRVRLYRRRHNAVATGVFWAMVLLREASRAALGSRPSRRAVGALLSRRRFRERPGPLTIVPAV